MDAAGITAADELPVLNNQGKEFLLDLWIPGSIIWILCFGARMGVPESLGYGTETLPPSSETSSFFPVLYGCQYTAAQINLALNSDDPASIVPTRDETGMEPSLASIAAGNRGRTRRIFRGSSTGIHRHGEVKTSKTVSPDFYLIRDGADAYQENDILMGVSYLYYALAREYSMPLVVCIALGTNVGSHMGNEPTRTVFKSGQPFKWFRRYHRRRK